MYRTYFIFFDDNKDLGRNLDWFKSYYQYAALLNRLITQMYRQKEPGLLNFHFCEEFFFKVRGVENEPRYRSKGDDWAFYITYSINEFSDLENYEKVFFIWDNVISILRVACIQENNQELLDAVNYANQVAYQSDFKTDYNYIEKEIELFNFKIKAIVHMKFVDADLVAMLDLYKDNNLIYETEIARAYVALDRFRDMIKDVEVDSKQRIIIPMKGEKTIRIVVDPTILTIS